MRRSATILAFVVACGALAVLPAIPEVQAEIYHYVDDQGQHHFTTYRVRGMELLEVLGGGDSSASQDRSSQGNGGRSRSRSRGRSYDHSAFDGLIQEAAEAYNLPFSFIKAVIRVESAFNPRAVSSAGAEGLMQLMPSTARGLGVSDSFDPRQNIFGGSLYLRQLSDRYNGDINLVLAAYNAGPGAVAREHGIPYEATRRYIQAVHRYYVDYLAQPE